MVDLDLQREIQLECVVDRHTVRRVHSAQVVREMCNGTVVMSQATAQKRRVAFHLMRGAITVQEWQQDVARYMAVRRAVFKARPALKLANFTSSHPNII